MKEAVASPTENLTKLNEKQLEFEILKIVHARIAQGMLFQDVLNVLESARFTITEIKLKHGVL